MNRSFPLFTCAELFVIHERSHKLNPSVFTRHSSLQMDLTAGQRHGSDTSSPSFIYRSSGTSGHTHLCCPSTRLPASERKTPSVYTSSNHQSISNLQSTHQQKRIHQSSSVHIDFHGYITPGLRRTARPGGCWNADCVSNSRSYQH